MTFQIEIPSTTRGASSSARRPRYISAGTQSIAVVVNGGAPQVFSVASPGGPVPNCTGPTQPIEPVNPPVEPATSCTWSLLVPPGPATFAVTLYSGPNATGSVLSRGRTSATIVAGASNDVAVTFDGIPAALFLELGTSAPPTGTASVIPVVVYTVDAAGYAIIGPRTNTTATLTDFDATTASGLFAATGGTVCGAAPGATTKSRPVTTGTLTQRH